MLKSIALLSERRPNKGKQGSMCTRNLWRWNEDKQRNILQCGVQGNRMVCYIVQQQLEFAQLWYSSRNNWNKFSNYLLKSWRIPSAGSIESPWWRFNFPIFKTDPAVLYILLNEWRFGLVVWLYIRTTKYIRINS